MTSEPERGSVEQAWTRVAQYDHWITLAIRALGVFVAVAIAWATVMTILYVEVHDQLKHSTCRDRVFNELFVGVGDAFNTPPAPNPARQRAVDEITQATKDLHNLEKECN